MDSSQSAVGGPTDCESVRPVRNYDMEAGDYYVVESDSRHGRADSSHLARRPAECVLAFNFGDRLASLTVDKWRCHLRDVHDPFLAVYDDCVGQRRQLLVSAFQSSFSAVADSGRQKTFVSNSKLSYCGDTHATLCQLVSTLATVVVKCYKEDDEHRQNSKI